MTSNSASAITILRNRPVVSSSSLSTTDKTGKRAETIGAGSDHPVRSIIEMAAFTLSGISCFGFLLVTHDQAAPALISPRYLTHGRVQVSSETILILRRKLGIRGLGREVAGVWYSDLLKLQHEACNYKNGLDSPVSLA